MLIKLVVGDWSSDGHGRTTTFMVETGGLVDGDVLKKFYQRGVEAVGLDITKFVCADYEDSLLPQWAIRKLMAAGWDHWEFDPREHHLDPEQFMEIWLFIAGRGCPDLKVRVLGHDEVPSINLGGYGLFYG